LHHRVDGLPDQPHDPWQSPHDCRKSDDRQLLYRKQRCQSFARHGQAAYSFEQDGITQTLAQHLHQAGTQPVTRLFGRDQKNDLPPQMGG